MTDLLLVAGLVLLATPLLLVVWWAFTLAAGLVLVAAALVRSLGEDLDRRARRTS